jgi:hypothetical protein
VTTDAHGPLSPANVAFVLRARELRPRSDGTFDIILNLAPMAMNGAKDDESIAAATSGDPQEGGPTRNGVGGGRGRRRALRRLDH